MRNQCCWRTPSCHSTVTLPTPIRGLHAPCQKDCLAAQECTQEDTSLVSVIDILLSSAMISILLPQ